MSELYSKIEAAIERLVDVRFDLSVLTIDITKLQHQDNNDDSFLEYLKIHGKLSTVDFKLNEMYEMLHDRLQKEESK